MESMIQCAAAVISSKTSSFQRPSLASSPSRRRSSPSSCPRLCHRLLRRHRRRRHPLSDRPLLLDRPRRLTRLPLSRSFGSPIPHLHLRPRALLSRLLAWHLSRPSYPSFPSPSSLQPSPPRPSSAPPPLSPSLRAPSLPPPASPTCPSRVPLQRPACALPLHTALGRGGDCRRPPWRARRG